MPGHGPRDSFSNVQIACFDVRTGQLYKQHLPSLRPPLDFSVNLSLSRYSLMSIFITSFINGILQVVP